MPASLGLVLLTIPATAGAASPAEPRRLLENALAGVDLKQALVPTATSCRARGAHRIVVRAASC